MSWLSIVLEDASADSHLAHSVAMAEIVQEYRFVHLSAPFLSSHASQWDVFPLCCPVDLSVVYRLSCVPFPNSGVRSMGRGKYSIAIYIVYMLIFV